MSKQSSITSNDTEVKVGIKIFEKYNHIYIVKHMNILGHVGSTYYGARVPKHYELRQSVYGFS